MMSAHHNMAMCVPTLALAVALLCGLAAGSAASSAGSTASSVARLTVDGAKLVVADGAEVRLVGANVVPSHFHDGDGADMVAHLPGANVIRLIGLYWGDTKDGVTNKDECMSDEPPHYFKEVLILSSPPSACHTDRNFGRRREGRGSYGTEEGSRLFDSLRWNRTAVRERAASTSSTR